MSFEDVERSCDGCPGTMVHGRIESNPKTRWRKQLTEYRDQSDGNRTEYSRARSGCAARSNAAKASSVLFSRLDGWSLLNAKKIGRGAQLEVFLLRLASSTSQDGI